MTTVTPSRHMRHIRWRYLLAISAVGGGIVMAVALLRLGSWMTGSTVFAIVLSALVGSGKLASP